MRFSEDQTTLDSVPWEPLSDEKPWMLGCRRGEACVVFGQFKDGAGNESLVVTDQILLEGMDLYMPLILR